MEKNKSGISLVVLVITIIVMIILAGAIILSLDNSGIIGKSQEAVDANNLKQVEDIAALAWSEAYMDKLEGKTVDIEDRVKKALENNNVDTNKYVIKVTDQGVNVAEKKLGSLIKNADDFGKTVDYTVTVDGTEHKSWQVYYEDESNGYVFLIASKVTEEKVLDGVYRELTEDEINLYNIFSLGKPASLATGSWMNPNQGAATTISLVTEFGDYANKAVYGDYVVGAMGGPTLNLLAAGWNAKGYSPTLTIDGRNIKGLADWGGINLSKDGLYLIDDTHILATPYPTGGISVWVANWSSIYYESFVAEQGIRPVICLKADTPATFGTTTDISLIK